MKIMNIRWRLIACFAFLSVLMAALMATSATVVGGAGDKLAAINEVNAVKQRHAINYRGSVHDRAIAIRDVVLEESAAGRATQVALIDTLHEAYATNETRLNALLAAPATTSPAGVEIHRRIDAIQAQTNPLVDEIIRLVDTGNLEEAQTLLMSKASPLFSAWLAVINEFIDLQEARSQSTGAALKADIANFSTLATGLLLAALLLAGGAAALTSRSILSPMRRLENDLKTMAEGQTELDATLARRHDEIGSLARAAVGVRDAIKARGEIDTRERDMADKTLRGAVDALGHGLNEMAAGRMGHRIDTPFGGALDKLRQDYNLAADRLRDSLSAIASNALSVTGQATKLARSTDELSSRTESQAATLEQTAAATEQLAMNAKASAQSAQEVKKTVQKTRQDAENSTVIVASAVDAMTRIEISSRQIAQTISVIEDIAFQTNLLALNAGVEAARAGETGRGFAVVASEVRALAQRSASSAQEIKTMIAESTAEVGDGVNQVRRTGEELQTIVAHVAEIAGKVQDIADSAEDQAHTISEINIGMSQLDQVTQRNAAMAQEARAICSAMGQNATDLTRQVGAFDTGSTPPGRGAAPIAA